MSIRANAQRLGDARGSNEEGRGYGFKPAPSLRNKPPHRITGTGIVGSGDANASPRVKRAGKIHPRRRGVPTVDTPRDITSSPTPSTDLPARATRPRWPPQHQDGHHHRPHKARPPQALNGHDCSFGADTTSGQQPAPGGWGTPPPHPVRGPPQVLRAISPRFSETTGPWCA